MAQSLPVETGERLRLFCMCILGVRSSRRVFAFILQSIQRNDGSVRSKASLPTSGLACKLPRLLLFFFGNLLAMCNFLSFQALNLLTCRGRRQVNFCSVVCTTRRAVQTHNPPPTPPPQPPPPPVCTALGVVRVNMLGSLKTPLPGS